MNFQEKVLEASTELRARAGALATATREVARDRAHLITVLGDARRAFGNVARRHGGQFMKQNSGLATAVRKDVLALARATFASITASPVAPAAARKTRRAAGTRKRSAKAA